MVEVSSKAGFPDSHGDEYRAAVHEIERIAMRAAEGDSGWLVDLRSRMPRATEVLRQRFQVEQSGALYRELPLKKPRFADALRRLEAEHDQILDRAQRVVRGAEAEPEPRGQDLHELEARLQLLLASIRRHEAEENEVIMRAHWQEFGTGD